MTLKPLSNEKELLAKIAEGDQRAFTLLFNHYHKNLFLFSIRLTKSEDVALEIVQDVFLKIWSVREKLVEVDSFGGYLSRIVRNHALNTLRQIARQAKSLAVVPIDSEDFEDPTACNLTDQQLDYNQALFVLKGALESLAPQQKLVYQLCHIEGLKYEEAAQALNISPETVRAHMKKALSKIREHFRKNAILYPLLIVALSK
ncbi:RNA polymerase subunit sigma-70 [Solitalea longa]|uniref:RNA polymerase subunit sigma-70 n=1 Tax=Solitalea longa TaxID=2079460 RepID=A0A2S5A6E9_9SPHI|nr:RNA polymerase sigma-70 factor [Solitalea longa]POY37912.1 RNA polymerase subunit sigma-70 [Solitalea longa]